MSNIFVLKYFMINYILNFLYIIFNWKSFKKKFTLQEIYNNNKTKSENTMILCMYVCMCACNHTHLREQRKTFYRQKIPESSCARKETVDIDVLVTSGNSDMMSISIWGRVHFWIHLLNHNSLSHQTWLIDRYKQGQYFSGIFWTIWRTEAKFQVIFYLANCSIY